MIVHWTETALANLQAIRDYLARNSPGYAQTLADRIVRKAEMLGDLPSMGAEVPEYADESLREVLERPYRIIYRLSADKVEVLAVVHGARQLPRSLPE